MPKCTVITFIRKEYRQGRKNFTNNSLTRIYSHLIISWLLADREPSPSLIYYSHPGDVVLYLFAIREVKEHHCSAWSPQTDLVYEHYQDLVKLSTAKHGSGALSSEHETLFQCCFNAGPASQTLVQHWSNTGPTSRVLWWIRRCFTAWQKFPGLNIVPGVCAL